MNFLEKKLLRAAGKKMHNKKGHMRFLAFLWLGVFVLLLGCTSSQSPLKQNLLAFQEKWKSHNVKDYHIRMSFYENFANRRSTAREVTVKNGSIVSSTCVNANCPAFALRDINTIDDLFRLADSLTSSSEGYRCIQQLNYDSKYGFPNQIAVDCPNYFDDDYKVSVSLFEELK